MPATMKAIRKLGAGPGADMVLMDIPPVGKDEVLIRVIATSICGTDAHIYEWNEWASRRISPPQTYGHEFCGQITEVGRQVSSFRVGDYVSCDSHIPCGQCYQCRVGQSHLCAGLRILGVDRDGSFAEYVAVPTRSLVRNDSEMPPEVASVQDPLGNAVHATLVANVAGKAVAIFGMGPIGLFAVGVARAVGATTIYAVERYNYRLDVARRMGADVCLNGGETDVRQAILDETHGLGVDVILEMSGSPSAVSDGLAIVRKGGEFVSLGIPSSPITLDYANGIVFKGLTLYGINGRKLFQTWYQMKELLSSGRLDISPVLTHRFCWEDYEEGFRLMTARPMCCGKVVLFIGAEG